jgi:hypothetical protein
VSRQVEITSDVITPERRARLMRVLWDKTGGKGWEPPDPNHPLIVDAVESGYLRRTDGRCGCERIRDACVTWTEAGRAALS